MTPSCSTASARSSVFDSPFASARRRVRSPAIMYDFSTDFFTVDVVRRVVDVGQHAAAALAAEDAEGADGALAKIGRAGFRGAHDDVERPLRTGLAEDEQRALLQLRRLMAVEDAFEDGDGALGIAVHQAVDGHQLHVFIVDVLRLDLLAGGLADFDFERLAVLDPFRLRIRLLELQQRRQRLGTRAHLSLRVREPVERGVGVRHVHLGDFAEALPRRGASRDRRARRCRSRRGLPPFRPWPRRVPSRDPCGLVRGRSSSSSSETAMAMTGSSADSSSRARPARARPARRRACRSISFS